LNSPEIKKLINEHGSLFWYIPEDKKEEISSELLVETIFNYGDLEDIKNLITIIGTDKLSQVFYGLKGRKKLNYYPEIYNFFSMLIKRYEHPSIKSKTS
jgi:hypothetical protein